MAVGALVFNLVFLLPLMQTPFLGDDSWCESTTRGYLALTNTSLGQFWWAVEKDYIKSGRWYPLITYYYPLFYFAGREAYKALVIGLILINVAQFGALVNSVTRSKSMAIMAMLMPPLFFQLRLYHDPILSYYGLMQVEASLILGSLSFFARYLATTKEVWLVGSVTLYGLNLLTYEAFYGIIAAHALLAFHQWREWSSRKITKTLLPFIALAAANILVMLALRSFYTVQYSGNQLNLTASTWGLTFAKQAIGALPLSYFMSFPENVGVIFADMSPGALAFIGIASVALCVLVCGWFKGRPRAKNQSKGLAVLGILGLSLWITPCIIVSGAVKYQQELKWGLAYLPVYISYFGCMMLVLAGMEYLRQILQHRPQIRTVVSVASGASLACVFTLNYALNLHIVAAYRNAELRPRLLVETALRNGLLQSAPRGSYLICGLPIRAWDTPAFYKMHSGRSLQVVREGALDIDQQLCTLHIGEAFGRFRRLGDPTILDFEQGTQTRPVFAGYTLRFDGLQGPILELTKTSAVTSAPPDVFFLTYASPKEGSGMVVLARVKKLKANNERILSAAAETLSIFLESQDQNQPKKMQLCGQLIDLDTLDPGPWFTVTAQPMPRHAQKGLGVILTLCSNQPGFGVEPRSLSVVTPTDSN